MSTLTLVGSLVVGLGLFAAPGIQAVDDPTVLAAVERYYKVLEAEDIEAYLALWSRSVQRPQPQSLKYLFDSGDERFSDIQISRAVMVGDRLRVRLRVRSERTRPARDPGGPPLVATTVRDSALTFVKEADGWKLVSEGSPADDLAVALVAAATPDDREALLQAESDLLNIALVTGLARIADSAAIVREYPRAQSIYERVVELARRIGNKKAEGEGLQNLGNTFYFQGKFPEALAAYEQRLALERARGDDAATAWALAGIATIRYSRAEYTEALKHYRQALAIQERFEDRHASATTLISIGNVRYLQGDYSGAIRDYSLSRDFYRALPDMEGDARALEGLGRSYSAQGDYAAALSAFAGVLSEVRARADRARQGTVNQSIGDVHLRLGNLDAARKHYEESRDHFLALKNQSGAGRVWQALGMTELMAGRLDAAEQAYVRSMTICAGVADEECSAHAVVGLAFAQSAQDKFPEAIASYRKGIGEFTALRGREAAARAEVGLSQALAGANDIAAAIEAATRARQAALALESDDVLWRALTAEARALRKGGADKAKALAAARSAADVVERMQSAAFEKPATPVPADASGVFATLAVLQAELDDPAGAWASASRMRAVDLRNRLAVNEREIARGMTPEEREQERAMASEILSLLAQTARERALPKPDSARIAALQARISTAATSRAAWMQDLYMRLPDLRVWRGLAAPADTLTAVLTPGTVVLDFVVDDDDVLVMIGSSALEGGIDAYSTAIRRRALAERVNALLKADTLRDSSQWRKAAAQVSRLLPPQASALLAAASRIIVVPHDVLWRVPFEALPIGGGFLGDRAPVIYAGSPTSLVRAAAVEATPGKTMFGVGAPELMPAVKERLQQTAPGWAIRAADAAESETQTVATVYEGESIVLTSAGATEAAFREKAPSVSALHLAAPFRINGASPLFSPILLSGDPSSRSADDDGALELREIMNLNLRARVAVLSDGAATSMRDGAAAADAVQWGWLAAGVPSVVVARWIADSAASNTLLAEFHRRLAAGADPAAALHAARATVRARPEWAAPFYWAGWIGLGR